MQIWPLFNLNHWLIFLQFSKIYLLNSWFVKISLFWVIKTAIVSSKNNFHKKSWKNWYIDSKTIKCQIFLRKINYIICFFHANTQIDIYIYIILKVSLCNWNFLYIYYLFISKVRRHFVDFSNIISFFLQNFLSGLLLNFHFF